ncbi:MAG: hypothetical protein NTX79_05335 [Candidatus Micrarchaeota archaeon]|nr:hypothetical protein [Candidatus Micrarchaeota archaeon]
MATKSALMLAGLFLLLFLSFGCTDTSGVWKTESMGWNLLMGVAILIVVLLLSIGYMAAVFMGDDRLKAWVGRELGQVFFSAVIIVAVVALVGSLDLWMHVLSLAGGADWQNYVENGVCCVQSAGHPCPLAAASEARGRACHIEIATDYLQILYETARQSASAYLNNYGWFAFLSRISMSTTIVMKFMAGLTIVPFAGLEVPAELFAHLFDLSIKTMFLIRAQQLFLDFLWYPIFPVMISMGLVLRIFYFTRKLGGLLIALALALYVVFPMFYVLSSGILWGFMSHTQAVPWQHFGNTFDPSEGGAGLPSSGSPGPLDPSQNAKGVFAPQNTLKLDLCDSSTQAERDTMLSAMDGVRGKWDFLEGGKWYSQFLGFITADAFAKDGPIARLALLMVFTLFIPFLALMTSLAAFKVLSPLLGGDVEISLLSKLI